MLSSVHTIPVSTGLIHSPWTRVSYFDTHVHGPWTVNTGVIFDTRSHGPCPSSHGPCMDTCCDDNCCVYRTLVTTVIIPHLCFPAYYHSFDPQKNVGYAPMRWCMARYCHKMLSVTLVYCKYRKRHAWNICMRLNSPTSWVSVCMPTCIRIFRRRPADFPHGSSYYYNGSSKCGRRSLTSYRSRCSCLKFS